MGGKGFSINTDYSRMPLSKKPTGIRLPSAVVYTGYTLAILST